MVVAALVAKPLPPEPVASPRRMEAAMPVATRTNETTRPEASEMVMNLLTDAYLIEVETVMNLSRRRENLDELQGRLVAGALAAEIDEELGHARRLAGRISQLNGVVPGSGQSPPDSGHCSRPATAVTWLIAGVLDAETAAIATYTQLARAADGSDHVTHGLGRRNSGRRGRPPPVRGLPSGVQERRIAVGRAQREDEGPAPWAHGGAHVSLACDDAAAPRGVDYFQAKERYRCSPSRQSA
jgi:bacterioferritin